MQKWEESEIYTKVLKNGNNFDPHGRRNWARCTCVRFCDTIVSRTLGNIRVFYESNPWKKKLSHAWLVIKIVLKMMLNYEQTWKHIYFLKLKLRDHAILKRKSHPTKTSDKSSFDLLKWQVKLVNHQTSVSTSDLSVIQLTPGP